MGGRPARGADRARWCRLGESTGRVAKTLHRLLEAVPGRGFHGAPSAATCDLLIVDEMSMVDLPLMQAMLAALPREVVLLSWVTSTSGR